MTLSVCWSVPRFVEIVSIVYLYWLFLTYDNPCWLCIDLADLELTLGWPWGDFGVTLGQGRINGRSYEGASRARLCLTGSEYRAMGNRTRTSNMYVTCHVLKCSRCLTYKNLVQPYLSNLITGDWHTHGQRSNTLLKYKDPGGTNKLRKRCKRNGFCEVESQVTGLSSEFPNLIP